MAIFLWDEFGTQATTASIRRYILTSLAVINGLFPKNRLVTAWHYTDPGLQIPPRPTTLDLASMLRTWYYSVTDILWLNGCLAF
ncbi:hypothetical protein N7463_010721 [Penicillium fimorum]|uniref:Uncharacterized protein n=1 Tax=Penicillium fimorum TaxID=1882269 RepID=A0A9X0C222_9EURO|nr:hypothetical protein N7463_010721 [Penicillium fimorum]